MNIIEISEPKSMNTVKIHECPALSKINGNRQKYANALSNINENHFLKTEWPEQSQ
jgi:hypothetical protein